MPQFEQKNLFIVAQVSLWLGTNNLQALFPRGHMLGLLSAFFGLAMLTAVSQQRNVIVDNSFHQDPSITCVHGYWEESVSV